MPGTLVCYFNVGSRIHEFSLNRAAILFRFVSYNDACAEEATSKPFKWESDIDQTHSPRRNMIQRQDQREWPAHSCLA